MTILFVENRYKTYFFAEIAKKLHNDGHEIHWLIQNKTFKIKHTGFNNHVIPYPKASTTKVWQDKDDIEKIIAADRQVNFFGNYDRSYFYYYYDCINDIISKIGPTVVFGESTAFHELLAINVCKSKNIPYYHPTSCRYPANRFSFYSNDSMVPYHGSNDILSEEDASVIISKISNRSSKPDYMKKVKKNRSSIIKDRIKIMTAYLLGEKFNTPNPIIKYNIEKQKKQNIREWDKIAVKRISQNNKLNILYPLQMQPEANIDVWGRKHRNQLELIRGISTTLGSEYNFYVKPNPKSKYELSKELIDFVKKDNNVIALEHCVSMDGVFQDIDLFITITGTIAIECILSNKPVVNLVHSVNNNSKNCIYLEEVADIIDVIEKVKKGSFPKIGLEQKIEFIDFLNRTSFKGTISDPFNAPDCLADDNTENIVNAFKSLLNNL